MKAEIKLAKNPDYYYIEVSPENATETLALRGLSEQLNRGCIAPEDFHVIVLGLGNFYSLKYTENEVAHAIANKNTAAANQEAK